MNLYPSFVYDLKEKNHYLFPVIATESHKTFEELEKLLKLIFTLKPSRDDILIAVGGGLTLNLGGLAASLIMRGIRFYYVPTTLTGQIDACLGSKQAVNFRGAKNWIGIWNDPEFCYINPTFLTTLSKRELNSQAIEGVKLCLTTDKNLFFETFPSLDNFYSQPFKQLSSFVIKMVRSKIQVVKRDLVEKGYGMGMLYGHTIGHAIEMLSSNNLNHGESVGLGMLIAAKISHLLGIADYSLVKTHEEILTRLDLPRAIPSNIPLLKIMKKLDYNKKNYGGQNRFILLRSIGEMAINSNNYYHIVPKNVIVKAIQSCHY